MRLGVIYNLFNFGNQIWLCGMMYSLVSKVFSRPTGTMTQYYSCMSIILYSCCFIWFLISLEIHDIISAPFSFLGLLVGFGTTIKLFSYSTEDSDYFKLLVILFIGSTGSVICLYYNMTIDQFSIISEICNSLLPLSPTIGRMIYPGFASYPFYLYAIAYTSFWLILTFFDLDIEWWPTVLAAITFLAASIQFYIYMQSNVRLQTHAQQTETFVLQELRYNQSIPVSQSPISLLNPQIKTMFDNPHHEPSFTLNSTSKTPKSIKSSNSNNNNSDSRSRQKSTYALSPVNLEHYYTQDLTETGAYPYDEITNESIHPNTANNSRRNSRRVSGGFYSTYEILSRNDNEEETEEVTLYGDYDYRQAQQQQVQQQQPQVQQLLRNPTDSHHDSAVETHDVYRSYQASV
jgi:hypothetical protein